MYYLVREAIIVSGHNSSKAAETAAIRHAMNDTSKRGDIWHYNKKLRPGTDVSREVGKFMQTVTVTWEGDIPKVHTEAESEQVA